MHLHTHTPTHDHPVEQGGHAVEQSASIVS